MRLIDADELLKKMDIAIAMMERTMIALEIEDDAEAQMELKAYKDIRNGINDEPTVHPESNWISCKERLPELWDYVLCSQINGDVGEGKLLDDECWHICYDQSHRKKSWVVAWQPLPEKFKEEGGEE